MIRNKVCMPMALLWIVGICLLLPTPLRSQEAQAPLGDIVRKQQADRQRGKKAKHVVGDEDLAGSHLHEVRGSAATTVIIPDVTIIGMLPDGVLLYPTPESKQKLQVWFGPGSLDRCNELDCAEETYFGALPRTIGGSIRVLFESDDSIDGNPARIVHFEIAHDVRGKILGAVALIQTPVAAGAATCTYRAADTSDAESDCDAFIRSLRVRMPERYIYVQHNN